ncbi:MAG: polysaccharide pyruvyl transferase family protein [Bacteroidales bacterium]
MRIQIDGTNTQNKGAELMAYTIIQQIEQKFPDAEIVLNLYGNDFRVGECKAKITQPLRLKHFRYPRAILYRLGLPYSYFTEYYPSKKIDILLDASGFKFGDQWSYSKTYMDALENYYAKLKSYNTQIVLLPQAFGPFTTESSKRSIDILNKYVDIFFARESKSHQHLIESGISANKIFEYPDFTITAKGYVSERFKHLKDFVCLIPNSKMLSHSGTNFDIYSKLFERIEQKCSLHGKKAFLLNHEGEDDFDLCNRINGRLANKLPIVNQVNALEVKGLIGNSYMVISSRFHGVSSALNQAIPCLATSWSHKYQYLFQEFGLTNNIINVSENIVTEDNRVDQLLTDESNKNVRHFLGHRKHILLDKVEDMWKVVWNNVNQK